MSHETNHCDVIDCPACCDDDRLNERDAAFDSLVKVLRGCSLVYSAAHDDRCDSCVWLTIEHQVEADASDNDKTAAKVAMIRHLESLIEYLRAS